MKNRLRQLWQRHRVIRFFVKAGGFLLLSVLLLWIGAECYVSASANGREFDRVEDVKIEAPVLVLGCSPTIGRRDNLYFTYRMDSAAALWKAGKASSFVVSGDNGTYSYNEPEWMKKALMERGVPENRIVCDFAGFRTLDSVVRMKEVFGTQQCIIVSQQFHNERALAIAAYYDLDAVALNANNNVGRRSIYKSWLRERAARICMLLDLWVWGADPRFLGEPIKLPDAK